MKIKNFWWLCFFLLLISCTAYENDMIKTDEVKNCKLMVPPCLGR